MPRKLTTEEFIKNSIDIHGNRYDYSNVQYVSGHKKVSINCYNHGMFIMSPVCHTSQKQGCPICANTEKSNNMTSTSNQFIQKSKAIHGELYDYSLVEYVNAYTPVQIICKKHGVFNQLPSNHIHNKSNCPNCNFKESRGEQLISKILNEYNILYNRQHSFVGCNGYNKPLKYDFYIPTHNTVIEYDGRQHYKFIPHLHRTEEKFKLSQTYDKIKNDFCKNAGIRLIRIKTVSKNQIIKILYTHGIYS